jgi:hypothetical protein
MGIDRFFCATDVLRQKGLRVRSVRWGWFWAVEERCDREMLL